MNEMTHEIQLTMNQMKYISSADIIPAADTNGMNVMREINGMNETLKNE